MGHIFSVPSLFETWNFEIPLLIPSPRGTLIYEYFLKSALNAQGGDSYLNEFVYAESTLELFAQFLYNLGNCIPAGLVKLEFVGYESINSRLVTEVNLFKKRFWNDGRSTQLTSSL